MGYEHDRPKRAKFRDPSCVPPAVRWDDEASVQSWFSALREEVKDLRAAARDRVRPKRKRVLSRPEAGRQIEDSSQRLLWLLDAGEAGLDRLAPREPGPEPEGGAREDEPPFSSKRPRSTPPDTAG